MGKVTGVRLAEDGVAIVTLELGDQYGPMPSDTRAMLRQKTLLGEGYVELTPGDPEGPSIPDGGRLPAAQVAPSVELDEIFRTFDEPTRVAFQTWMADVSVALRGRGADLNTAFGLLPGVLGSADDVVRVLDSQKLAVREFVRGTGEVFGALSERQGQLRRLIQNTDRVFSVTAERNQDLSDLFVVLPTFLTESRETLTRLDRFAADTNPLVTQLRPSARELGPVLADLERLAPELNTFFKGLSRLTAAAPAGFGSLRAFLDQDLPPLLTRLPRCAIHRRRAAGGCWHGA